MIGEWIESGRIVDLILVLMAAEALLLSLVARSRRRSKRLPLRGLLFNLLAGACLLLALRAVASGSGVPAVGGWLTLALLAHLVDLGDRLRTRSASGPA